MAVLLHSSFRRLLIRSEMRTWYRVPVERYEKGGEGGVEASLLVSRRRENASYGKGPKYGRV